MVHWRKYPAPTPVKTPTPHSDPVETTAASGHVVDVLQESKTSLDEVLDYIPGLKSPLMPPPEFSPAKDTASDLPATTEVAANDGADPAATMTTASLLFLHYRRYFLKRFYLLSPVFSNLFLNI